MMNYLKSLLHRDLQRMRSLRRIFFYPIMRMEYYQLAPIRIKMFQHRFIDKQKAAEESEEGEWKWVFHIKDLQPKSYNRFWSYTKHKQNKEK